LATARRLRPAGNGLVQRESLPTAVVSRGFALSFVFIFSDARQTAAADGGSCAAPSFGEYSVVEWTLASQNHFKMMTLAHYAIWNRTPTTTVSFALARGVLHSEIFIPPPICLPLAAQFVPIRLELSDGSKQRDTAESNPTYDLKPEICRISTAIEVCVRRCDAVPQPPLHQDLAGFQGMN